MPKGRHCPECGAPIFIRIHVIDCTNCDWSMPRPSEEIENISEVRKVGEERFVPPKTIPHPQKGEKK